MGGIRTAEFIDTNRNGIDDRDEIGMTPSGAPASEFVYAPQIGRTEMRLDPIQQQLYLMRFKQLKLGKQMYLYVIQQEGFIIRKILWMNLEK